jgi:hypothetical protein
MTKLYDELYDIYEDEVSVDGHNGEHNNTNINILKLVKLQPIKKKPRNQTSNGKQNLSPVIIYITDTFPSLLAIPENAADYIYWNEFEDIVQQLLKGPPRNSVGEKGERVISYGWDESFEEKLPQDFIVNEPPNPPNMKIFAFKRKLVKYKDPVKSSGPQLWKIE